MKKKRIIRTFAVLAAACTLLTGCGQQSTAEKSPSKADEPAATAQVVSTAKGTEKTSTVGFFFDTVVTLTFYGADDTLASDMLEGCARYESLLSKTVEGSDVWNVNHAEGKPVKVDHETWDILRRAKEISEKTGGDFSVTIAPLTAMWDFTGGTERMPTEEERLAALPLIDDSLITLGDDGTVTIPEGHMIDLGGIAKGYIADQMAAMAKNRCYGAVLNFGGNTYVVGEKPEAKGFRVALQDPWHPDSYLGVLEVKDRTVVTSGTYERYFVRDGVTYHHILDPRTGSSAVTDLVAATIVGISSMDADAFATACIVKGKEGALALMAENGLNGIVVTQDGEITTTPGFTDQYQLTLVK